MYLPQKRLIIALIAGIVCAGCSDTTSSDTNPVPTRIYLQAGHPDMAGSVIDDGTYGFYLLLGYDDGNNCQLSNETYATIEIYSDNRLWFPSRYELNEQGYASLNEILLNHNLPSSSYDWECVLSFFGSEEGTYEFALKFYQPDTDTYYITPRHRLKIGTRPSQSGAEDWVTAEVTVSEP